jgi:CNT family concentrative nucleoside transporter
MLRLMLCEVDSMPTTIASRADVPLTVRLVPILLATVACWVGVPHEVHAQADAGAPGPDSTSSALADAGAAGDSPDAASPGASGAAATGTSATSADAGPAPDAPSAEPEAAGNDSASTEATSLDQLKGQGGSVFNRLISLFGILALIAVAWSISEKRREVDWELVAWGVGLQLTFAFLIFYVPGVDDAFALAGDAVERLLKFTDEGSKFIFKSYAPPHNGSWAPALKNFAFQILPTIIFFSSLMTILYYLGVMQWIVRKFARLMRWTMGISGAESLSASANIFVGQTEAPLVVKPYVEEMTKSELMVVMTGGFATVAGGVMAIYVGMLSSQFPNIAQHLIAASVMSAPAAVVIAKVIFPETETPETLPEAEEGDAVEEIEFETKDANVLDAASRGASEGLDLALNVGAMLLAFLALIAMINYLIGWPSMKWNMGVLQTLADYYQSHGMEIPKGCAPDAVESSAQAVHSCVTQMAGADGAPSVTIAPALTLQKIFGYVFWPFAWVMGVPTEDCFLIAQLLGEKMVVNELVAYSSLAEMLSNPNVELQRRSVIIATYALCGFANFGSIGIQLGGIGGIAPSRKTELAQIALKAMIGGTLAAMMTATVAGVLVS